ncbi:hypothetical protein RJ639_016684, partial [Escallonia herrerae]
MEKAGQQEHQQKDRVSLGGERPFMPDNLTEQPLPPKDERIISANPSPDAAILGPVRNITDQVESLDTSGALSNVYPFNTYSPPEQSFYYGGYDNGTGSWGEYSNYVNANNLQIVPPAVYNDPSLFFNSGYGFDPQAYGFSPLASPMSPIMVDGQLYSPHQIPMSPYYPQSISPSLPHATSAMSMSQAELMTPGSSAQEGLPDNMLFGSGSGYYVHFGGGNLSGNNSLGFYKYPGDFGSSDLLPSRSNSSDPGSYYSPLTSGAVYPQPISVPGSYEHSIGQVHQQQTPYHGFGVVSSSSTRHYPQGGSYRNLNYGGGSISHWGSGRFPRGITDKGGKRDRDRESISTSTDSHGLASDRNRGPRASKPKSKNSTEESSLPALDKNSASTSGVNIDLYNRPDFATDYESARFFVIKSFSEDNVHKSIKYNIWASTPLGNRKLDAAYHEAKEAKGNCPIFLFFSVNASGQFCGVAEMVGPVDFENDAEYWQQDRWSGRFPVQWHIIKDVPNSRFRHILLDNNEDKPVTHSRDSQEVKLEQGVEMLKIFKDHDADMSILDDFIFYNEREKALQEKKARQQVTATNNASVVLADANINQLSDNLAGTLQLEDSRE